MRGLSNCKYAQATLLNHTDFCNMCAMINTPLAATAPSSEEDTWTMFQVFTILTLNYLNLFFASVIARTRLVCSR